MSNAEDTVIPSYSGHVGTALVQRNAGTRNVDRYSDLQLRPFARPFAHLPFVCRFPCQDDHKGRSSLSFDFCLDGTFIAISRSPALVLVVRSTENPLTSAGVQIV